MYKDTKKEETLGETEAIRIFKWKQLDDSENADDSGRSAWWRRHSKNYCSFRLLEDGMQ